MAETPATSPAMPATSPVKPETNHAQPTLEQKTTAIEQGSPQSSDSPISDQFIQSPSPNQSPESTSPLPLPDCINSITERRSFYGALSAFYRCFDDLVAHLDSVKTAIDCKLVRSNPSISSIPSLPAEESVPNSSRKTYQETYKEKENGLERASSELEILCAKMSSRCLKKYITSNLGEPDKLREEVPKALKLAPNPAKFILESSGRFFLQGRKAYEVDSPMVAGREASVLMLECFLLLEKENNDVQIDKATKEEADQWAELWRKRLLAEGGLASACEIDARGLLMFLGCFGISSSFRYEDINDLVNASNVKGIVSVLKRSSILMEKITEAIDWMVTNKMGVEGVNLAYSFEVQDSIKSRSILASFLREAKESWKSAKSSSRESTTAMNYANKKHLAALKSVVKCAERHDIDAANLLPGWQVDEKIKKLEDKIAEFESERAIQKRKADEIDSSRKLKTVEMKRMRHTIVAAPVDGQRNYLDRIPPGHLSSSYPPPLLHGGAGLPETNSGSAGVAYVHGESIVDSTGRVIGYTNPHYSHGHVTYEDRSVGHYAGQRSNHDLIAQYGEQPSSADLVGHYAGQPSSADLIPHFAGLPSSSSAGGGAVVAVASRTTTPGSELYQFGDVVAGSDAYPPGIGAVPPVVSSHHPSSYLF